MFSLLFLYIFPKGNKCTFRKGTNKYNRYIVKPAQCRQCMASSVRAHPLNARWVKWVGPSQPSLCTGFGNILEDSHTFFGWFLYGFFYQVFLGFFSFSWIFQIHELFQIREFIKLTNIFFKFVNFSYQFCDFFCIFMNFFFSNSRTFSNPWTFLLFANFFNFRNVFCSNLLQIRELIFQTLEFFSNSIFFKNLKSQW